MPPTPVPVEIDEFLRQPNHAVVGTLRPDGSPHTAVTWYDWEDGRVLLNMDATRMRLAWMAHDGRVAVRRSTPRTYYHISLLGRIVEIRRRRTRRHRSSRPALYGKPVWGGP